MNLLCISSEDSPNSTLNRHLDEWRRRHHIVHVMPPERLLNYLRFETASTFLAQIDAIVCDADIAPFSVDGLQFRHRRYSLATALQMAQAVRSLPDACAMHDGRKWKCLPIAIFANALDFDFCCTMVFAVQASPRRIPERVRNRLAQERAFISNLTKASSLMSNLSQ